MAAARRWWQIHSSETVTVLYGKVEREGNQEKKAERAGRGALVFQECSSGKHKAPPLTLLGLMKSMRANVPCEKATSDRDSRTIERRERRRLILQEPQPC